MHFSILSDLKKTTVVVECLSTTSTRCSVTEITSLLQDSSVMVHNQHVWSYQARTPKFHTHPTYRGQAHLQFSFLIIFCISLFAVMLPYSTAHDTNNISSWITVSHHPDDVIVISSSSPLVKDLSDQFIQPTAEHILQLISHLDHKPGNHTRSISAIHQKCKLCKKC